MRLGASKGERLELVIAKLGDASPFNTGAEARSALEEIMRNVEDKYSGIPENPNAATSPTDGRMYPPSDEFEIASGSPKFRTFKQLRHRTSFGENGAVRITRPDGSIEIDLCGADGRSVADLLLEN